MAGWNLTKGELNNNENINFFSIVSKALLSKQYKTTTYKFCFFKCILDNIFDVEPDYKINFKNLNNTFIEVYWNLVNVHDIPQTYLRTFPNRSGIERLISDFCSNHANSKGVSFDLLPVEVAEYLKRKSLPIFKKFVIGAFYFETNGYLYGFDKSKNEIYFNKASVNFLMENKVLLEQINYYEWLKMCESILLDEHKSCNNLSLKLEWITKRTNLLKYKKALEELNNEKVCFYCGKKCSSKSHLDHVIPWDFIKKDDLWNLVWSCPTCNCSKNDSIPDDEYINKLITRNKHLDIESPDIIKIANIAEANGVSRGWKPKTKINK